MHFRAHRTTGHAAAAAVAALVLGLTPLAAQAQQKTFVMKVTTPTLNAAPDMYAKAFGAAVEKASGGRIKAEVYPASQLGPVPRQIEGTQFGSIQCAVIPPEFFVGVDERFEVLAAPGLVSSAALKRWTDTGGELIELPAGEKAQMVQLLASVGADVAKSKPKVDEAYKIVTDAVARLK